MAKSGSSGRKYDRQMVDDGGSPCVIDSRTRNLDIAGKLGCLDTEGLADLRQDKAPTVRRGPYKRDQLSVDHIVPRAVVPELDNVIANLELMPLRMNEGKSDRVGSRQADMARKFHKAGLLSDKGLKALLETPR